MELETIPSNTAEPVNPTRSFPMSPRLARRAASSAFSALSIACLAWDKKLAGIGEKHATRSALQQYCPGGSVFGGNQHPTVIRSREIALRVSATANIHNVAVEGRQEAAFRTSPAPPPRTFGFENGKFRERHGGERGLDAWSGQHRDAWS
jgi:hypothetical protein